MRIANPASDSNCIDWPTRPTATHLGVSFFLSVWCLFSRSLFGRHRGCCKISDTLTPPQTHIIHTLIERWTREAKRTQNCVSSSWRYQPIKPSTRRTSMSDDGTRMYHVSLPVCVQLEPSSYLFDPYAPEFMYRYTRWLWTVNIYIYIYIYV